MVPRSNTRDSGQRQLKSEEGLPCSPLGTVHNYQSPHTHKRSQTAGKANTQGGGEEQRLTAKPRTGPKGMPGLSPPEIPEG